MVVVRNSWLLPESVVIMVIVLVLLQQDLSASVKLAMMVSCVKKILMTVPVTLVAIMALVWMVWALFSVSVRMAGRANSVRLTQMIVYVNHVETKPNARTSTMITNAIVLGHGKERDAIYQLKRVLTVMLLPAQITVNALRMNRVFTVYVNLTGLVRPVPCVGFILAIPLLVYMELPVLILVIPSRAFVL